MDLAALTARLTSLRERAASVGRTPDEAGVVEVQQGTLTAMRALYGEDSSNERQFLLALDRHRHARPDLVSMVVVLQGALGNMLAEASASFVGSLQARVAGEILGDLVGLAREVLSEAGVDATNVGAVLAAAAFEDSMRRLAVQNGIRHHEKLADVLTALKDASVLQGSQVAISQSFLSFRNRALHAKWAEISRADAQAVIAFTEAIITRHFV